MIITEGLYRFKKVKSLKGLVLRPTSSKVRQAIFNILIHKFNWEDWKANSCMLDAYAGTGIVSFEAISRGISKVTLIEKNKKVFKLLVNNVNNFKLEGLVETINYDFMKVNKFDYKYKLVYLDPPYHKGIINTAIEKIIDMNVLEKKSVLICETEKNIKFEDNFTNYLIQTKTYGPLKLSFFSFI
tara:strand:+ start:130 stop:684 length:555 start_codon:yes stop_codon:yes gene_type:complete